MATLRSGLNTPKVKRLVRAEFTAQTQRRRFRTVFEHGQWWVLCKDPTCDDEGEVIYAVEDASGPGTTGDFYFERT
jgi:hypothetical protein